MAKAKKSSPSIAPTRFKAVGATIFSFVRSLPEKASGLIKRFPLASFFGLLALLLVLVVIGNQLRKPAAETSKPTPAPKSVAIYQLGNTPSVAVQGKVEKSGVITIVAQTAGIVSNIAVVEGDSIKAGRRLVSLSSNYRGANASSVSRQLAQRNYQHVLDTMPTQEALIKQNRELAEKSEVQAKELREIGRAAQADTRTQIDLNNEIIKGLDEQIADLEANNATGSADAQIIQIKTGKSQVLAALNGLKAALKASEYTNSEDQEIAGITGLVKETTLKQLELQEKALSLNKDVALLNVRLAQIGESLMYPATPCTGVVERIHVKVGQMVQPGTVIATIKADKSATTVEALVARPIAEQVSKVAPSTIALGDATVQVAPRYVSTEPTAGTLHSVLFNIPEGTATEVSNGSYVTVFLPLGAGITAGRYLPIDAVYYSQDGAYVYVVNRSQTPAQAHIQKVELGEVFGQMVELITGLDNNAEVILDRTVVETDPIAPQLSEQ